MKCLRTILPALCAFVIAGVAWGGNPHEPPHQSQTLVISGQNGIVYSGLDISTTSGPCIQIVNSTNITIKASKIGPCGTNNTTALSSGIYISGGTVINIYDN